MESGGQLTVSANKADEDNFVEIKVVDWLEDEGFEVIAVENGLEALEFLETNVVDVGVFDIKMPGMDGLTLLRKVVQIKKSFPVVMMTAHATVESAVNCMREGAYDYVIKPFAPEKLTKLIENIIAHQRLASEHERLQQEWASARLELDRAEKLWLKICQTSKEDFGHSFRPLLI